MTADFHTYRLSTYGVFLHGYTRVHRGLAGLSILKGKAAKII